MKDHPIMGRIASTLALGLAVEKIFAEQCTCELMVARHWDDLNRLAIAIEADPVGPDSKDLNALNDPDLQEKFSAAIMGAMMYGHEGANRPAEGHWLAQFWQIAHDMAQKSAERDRLHALVNSPHTDDFLESVRMEIAHQVERWGTVHDRAKEPADWYWLLAYLGGKALAAHIAGDVEKAKHHTISSAAVLANWHAAITCADNRMAPGAGDLQQFLQERFGDAAPAVAEA